MLKKYTAMKLFFCFIFLAACIDLVPVAIAEPLQVASVCDNTAHLDRPHAVLSNGSVQAIVFLPDKSNGYYHSSRFDWSGIVGCAAYKGHTFWGEWRTYDPLSSDSITGPVEEFRSTEKESGYANASVGGAFVKIGVGVLRRDSDAPYQFGHLYPLVDGGRWKVVTKPRKIVFIQKLQSPTGTVYEYRKTLELDRHSSVFTIAHELKNLGKQPILSEVYEHDFFMVDHQPTGPGMELTFPFVPQAEKALEPVAAIAGKSIVYRQQILPEKTTESYITGYSTSPRDYDIRFENKLIHAGFEQTSDNPIARLYLWSIPATVCPEAFIHLDILPGKSARWTLHYRLFAEDVVR